MSKVMIVYGVSMKDELTLSVQSIYPYNDNLYNDITPITIFSLAKSNHRVQSTYNFYPYSDNLCNNITPTTIFSCQAKSSCSVYIQCFTPLTIWPIAILPL